MKTETHRYGCACRMILFIAVLFFSTKGVAMSIFSNNEEEVILFSSMEGRITFEGNPAAGAKIVRGVRWKSDVEETETTITDEKGFFQFPVKTGALKVNPLSQFVAHQRIFVFFDGNQYQIWGNGKLDKKEFSEFGGKPKNLRCELTDEPDRVDVKNGWVMTSCKWNMEE